jgi:hypothetical protein
MSEAMEAEQLVMRQLVAALQDCLETAAETGHNLPEMLREALESLAVSYRSVEALVAQRPGSWEAEHVRALAAGAQHEFDEALRQEAGLLGHRLTYNRDLVGHISAACACGGWSGSHGEDMLHVRSVVEEHLRVGAAAAGHQPLWRDGHPITCTCGWPNALEEHGATILDHFRRVLAPPPPSPAERAAELARRYGHAQGEEASQLPDRIIIGFTSTEDTA